MKKIRFVFNLLCAFCSIMIFSLVLLIQSSMYQSKTLFFAVMGLDALFCMLLIYLMIRQYSVMKSAKLIIENQLLHIPVAKTTENEEESIDFYLSGFGMLLGDVVIPFNVGKERLHNLFIDKETTTITYGTERKKKTVKIYKKSMTEQQLEDFQKRLFFETGIVAQCSE